MESAGIVVLAKGMPDGRPADMASRLTVTSLCPLPTLRRLTLTSDRVGEELAKKLCPTAWLSPDRPTSIEPAVEEFTTSGGAASVRTVTVVEDVPAGSVTVPWALSTLPALAETMLLTNNGSSNFTGALPLIVICTRFPDCGVMVKSIVAPLPTGTRCQDVGFPEVIQLVGRPRPMTAVPSEVTETLDSSMALPVLARP